MTLLNKHDAPVAQSGVESSELADKAATLVHESTPDTNADVTANSAVELTTESVVESTLESAANSTAYVGPEAAFDCDIIIVGAGPVGLALAGDLMRRSATAPLSLILLDARDLDASTRDPRVLALSYGSRVLLEPLGWSNEVTPIEKIHISQRGHFGRAEIDRHEHDLPALGYVVRYGALTRALHAGFHRQVSSGGRAQLRENCAVIATRQDAEGVTVQFSDATRTTGKLRARLVIHAEGGLASHAIEERRSRDYGQTAIVGAVRCDAPLPRVAWERFTLEGPIALLPLAESGAQHSAASLVPASASASSAHAAPAKNATAPQRACDYALVWCQTPDNAQRRLALSDADFLMELGHTFGSRVGHFTHIEGRARFPLGLQSRTTLVDGLTAAIGNAAQTLHPVAGQGLNLGMRDAQALAAALGQHGPTAAALQKFATDRRVDRTITIGLTDSLARGFTVDFPPLAALRGFALAALDFLPATKTLLARQMMFGQRR